MAEYNTALAEAYHEDGLKAPNKIAFSKCTLNEKLFGLLFNSRREEGKWYPKHGAKQQDVNYPWSVFFPSVFSCPYPGTTGTVINKLN